MLVIAWFSVAAPVGSLVTVIAWLPSNVVTAAAAAVESFVWEIWGFEGGGGSVTDEGVVGAVCVSAGQTQFQFQVQFPK